eukprot:gene41839-51860_t
MASSSLPQNDSSANLSTTNSLLTSLSVFNPSSVTANNNTSTTSYLYLSDDDSGNEGQGRYSIGGGGSQSKSSKQGGKNVKYNKVKKRPLTGAAAAAAANAALRIEAANILFRQQNPNYVEPVKIQKSRNRGHSNVSNSDKRSRKKKAEST